MRKKHPDAAMKMKRIINTLPVMLCFDLFALPAFAQTPTAWGYSTGYGNVYG
jgi:hypothetical protein